MENITLYIMAFTVGGILCVIAQLLIDKTAMTPARILVGYVVAGVILGGMGIYEKLTEIAGAGATVPLTGFGYLMAKGTREAVDDKGLLGVLTGPLTAGSAGISAAIVFALIMALIFRSKRKK
ncbi:MAG: stage V sporulation protein AE [Clostridia bacterium]|nr:stage V sporulation protein AE [Clostridia bacterium]